METPSPQANARQKASFTAALKKVFEESGDFEAVSAAEGWLDAHGFSVGTMERDAPRAIFDGSYIVEKWSHLSQAERAQACGTLTGNMRNGPVTVTLDRLTRKVAEQVVRAALTPKEGA
jgi:hypothetical protein